MSEPALRNHPPKSCKKYWKWYQNGRPGEPLGAPWAPKPTPKRTKYKYLAQVFCKPVSEGLLARTVDQTGSELDVWNSVRTAPARADRMLAVSRKTWPGTTFLKDFDVFLGAKSSYLDYFGCTVALFFAAGFGVVVSTMQIIKTHHGNHQTSAQNYIKSEGKVYLSDKAYDQIFYNIIHMYILCIYIYIYIHTYIQHAARIACHFGTA